MLYQKAVWLSTYFLKKKILFFYILHNIRVRKKEDNIKSYQQDKKNNTKIDWINHIGENTEKTRSKEYGHNGGKSGKDSNNHVFSFKLFDKNTMSKSKDNVKRKFLKPLNNAYGIIYYETINFE